jgi:mono/diheme cytochrome c family protein/glucose/arabinose dehydrogenase
MSLSVKRMMAGLCIVSVGAIALAAPPDPGDETLKRLKDRIPQAPALSPEDAIKAFQVAPGYRVELVASEPLVNAPIAMCFDPNGRLWVCEMSGYMPDTAGTNENRPVGRIVILEDTDGDGKMDKRSVFLDGLVLPRALCLVGDGILVAENAKLWHVREKDGKAGEKTLIGPYGVGGNAEHQSNGLMPALDNWIYSANHRSRLKRTAKGWIQEPTIDRGQWGITQDDLGRLYYNSNSSIFRGDRVPCYSPAAHIEGPLTNRYLALSGDVFPARITPGINRYFQLRPDGTLKSVTAACGPVVFRGDNLPADARGNAFVCEPAGNLVKRLIFTEEKGQFTTKFAYPKSEFLASTDERFRPVNACNAPDGCLYIVDMYRGIIQHKTYMTPFLRKQVLDRKLEKPLDQGRIYRIVHESSTKRKPAALGKASVAELVEALSHPNGWHRDTAQRLLVAKADADAIPLLTHLLSTSPNPLGRLHAFWTLEGMDALDADILSDALADKDAAVRSSGVAVSKRFLKPVVDPVVFQALKRLHDDPSADVRRELVLSLGTLTDARVDGILEPVLKKAAEDTALRDTVIAGFAGREDEFLTARLGSENWQKPEPWRVNFLRAIATRAGSSRYPLTFLRILNVVGAQPTEGAWRQLALLDGLRTGAQSAVKGKAALPLRIPVVPTALERALKSDDVKLRESAQGLAKLLIWPGKDGKPIPMPPPLSAAHQLLYDDGKKTYGLLCAACHHPEGYGEPGKAPPLLDSDWLSGTEERVVRVVLHGLRGPISVNKAPFNRDGSLEMPAAGLALDDRAVAGVLTFVRREWGNAAKPIDPETVRRVRAATKGQTDAWTEKELQKIK